jgi:hypothetical protein
MILVFFIAAHVTHSKHNATRYPFRCCQLYQVRASLISANQEPVLGAVKRFMLLIPYEKPQNNPPYYIGKRRIAYTRI